MVTGLESASNVMGLEVSRQVDTIPLLLTIFMRPLRCDSNHQNIYPLTFYQECTCHTSNRETKNQSSPTSDIRNSALVCIRCKAVMENHCQVMLLESKLKNSEQGQFHHTFHLFNDDNDCHLVALKVLRERTEFK